MKTVWFALGFIASFSAKQGFSSSPAAWDELQKEVSQKCLERFQEAAGKGIKDGQMLLDVTGAQTWITGLLRYTEPASKKTVTMSCTYDKAQKKVVELVEFPSLDDKANWKSVKLK